MTEQELHQEILTTLNLASLSEGIIRYSSPVDRLVAIAKVYASAQVAEKDAEIRNLKSYVAALESDSANHSMNLDHLDGEVSQLKVENERLAEEAKRMIEGFRELFKRGKVTLEELKTLLSPAPENPEENPEPDILCPKCNSHLVERIGVGIDAGILYKCWECRNEWES